MRIYEIETPDIQSKFRARMRHFQRLGIPLGKKPGRGAPAEYTEDDLYQWVFCFEMAEIGVAPQSIVEIVQDVWASTLSGMFDELMVFGTGEELFVFVPHLLSSYWTVDDASLQSKTVDDISREARTGFVYWTSNWDTFNADRKKRYYARRLCILDIEQITRRIAKAI